MIKKLHQFKNTIKYLFKINIDTEDLFIANRLYHNGYMSKRTYKRILELY